MLKFKDLVLNLKLIENKVRFASILYCVVVTSFSLLGVIFQTRLFILQQYSTPTEDQEVKSKINKVLDLMLVTGQIFRGCGAVGICYYSLIAAAQLVYCLPYVIPELRIFDYCTGNRFLTYLIEPEIEIKRASLMIDKFIRNIIESNRNITKIALGKLSGNDLFDHAEELCLLRARFDEEADQHCHQLIENLSSKDRDQTRNLKCQSTRIYNNHLQVSSLLIGEKECRNYCSISKINFLVNLRGQLQYLERLKSRKHKHWPSTFRNSEWANQTKIMTLIAYLIFLTGMWLFAELVTCAGILLSFELIQSSKFGIKYQRVTFMDRLAGFSIIVNSYICVLMAVDTSLIMLASILDISKHLSIIKSEVIQFKYKLSQLEHVMMKEVYRTKRDIYFERDKLTIELYIGYLIFRNEMKASIQVAEIAASQTVSFILLVIVPLVPFLKHLSRREANVLIIIFLMSFFLMDFWLLVCSAVNAYCMKQSKRIWSFIAYGENYNLEAFNIMHSIEPDDIRLTPFNQVNNTIMKNFDFEYHSYGFITFHTMLLWRKLAINQELISDHFICKLFSIFEVSYRSILRYNYWLLSGALVILTYD